MNRVALAAAALAVGVTAWKLQVSVVHGAEERDDSPSVQELIAIARDLDIALPPRDKSSVEDYRRTCEIRVFHAVRERCQEAANESDWKHLTAHKGTIDRLRSRQGHSLFVASIVEGGSFQLVKGLYQHDLGGIHSRDRAGNTALHLAVTSNRSPIVRLLAPCFKNLRNERGETSLHMAILEGRAHLVRDLLQRFSDPDLTLARHGMELDALQLSVVEGKASCLHQVVRQRNKPLEFGRHEQGEFLLHLGLQFQQAATVRFLVNQCGGEAGLKNRDEEGRTPLALAAALGDFEMTRFLGRRRGVDLNAPDQEGNGPLALAVLSGCGDVAALLVRLGADVKRVNEAGQTPLQLAMTRYEEAGRSPEALVTYNILDSAIKARRARRGVGRDYTVYPPKALTFQGGGAKGPGLLGALLELEKRGLLGDVERTAGTSAGAITAALYSVGYSPKEMERILLNFNFEAFMDASPHQQAVLDAMLKARDQEGGWWSKLKAGAQVFKKDARIKEWASAVWLLAGSEQPGICDGEFARKWIDNKIASKLAELTGRPEIEFRDLTFGELQDLIEQGVPVKHLHVYTIRLTRDEEGQIERFGSENGHGEINAEWKRRVVISDAVVASMSIPGVFRPARIRSKEKPGLFSMSEALFVDGGLLINNPLKAFDHEGYQKPGLTLEEAETPRVNRDTLGIALKGIGDESTGSIEPQGLVRLVGELAAIHLEGQTARLLHDQANLRRMAVVEHEGIGTLDFQLTEEKKRYLLSRGSSAIRKLVGPIRGDSHDRKAAPRVASYYMPRPKLEKSVARVFSQNVKSSIAVRVLWGASGTGKTQLARRVAQDQLKDGAIYFEINCAHPKALYESYASFADRYEIERPKEAGLDPLRKKVNQFLEAQRLPWVGVFLRPSGLVDKKTLPSKGGYILIAAKTGKVWLGLKDCVEVKPFSMNEAFQFLETQLGSGDDSGNTFYKLVEALNNSPRAIHMAAEYMRTVGMRPEDYLYRIYDLVDELPAVKQGQLSPEDKIVAVRISNLPKNVRNWVHICGFLGLKEVPITWFYVWREERELNKSVNIKRWVTSLEEHGVAILRHEDTQEVVVFPDAVQRIYGELRIGITERVYRKAFRWMSSIYSLKNEGTAEAHSVLVPAWRRHALKLLQDPYWMQLSPNELMPVIHNLLENAWEAEDREVLQSTIEIGIQASQAMREHDQLDLETSLRIERRCRELEAQTWTLLKDRSNALKAADGYLKVVETYDAENDILRAMGLFLKGQALTIDPDDGESCQAGLQQFQDAYALLEGTAMQAAVQSHLGATRVYLARHVKESDAKYKQVLAAIVELNAGAELSRRFERPPETSLAVGYTMACHELVELEDYATAQKVCDCAAKLLPSDGVLAAVRSEMMRASRKLAQHGESKEKATNIRRARRQIESLLRQAAEPQERGRLQLDLGHILRIEGDEKAAREIFEHIQSEFPEYSQLYIEATKELGQQLPWYWRIFGY